MSRAPSNELHDKNDLSLRLDGIIELGYVRMIESLHQLYLSPHRLFALKVLHLLLQVDLQGNLLIVPLMHANVHSSVGTLTNLLPHDVILHRVILAENNNLFFGWLGSTTTSSPRIIPFIFSFYGSSCFSHWLRL